MNFNYRCLYCSYGVTNRNGCVSVARSIQNDAVVTEPDFMKFVDDGEVDDKVIAVPSDDRNTGNAINSLADLPEQLLKQIEHHFNHYKDLKKPGSTVVEKFADIAEAKEVIRESIQRWQD